MVDMGDFAFGSLDNDVLQLALEDVAALVGRWEVLGDRSESHEAILCALGVPYMKRAVMKHSKPVTEITTGVNSDGKPILTLTSHLPLGNKKVAEIILDGSPFEIDDGDTGFWTSRAMVKDGVLYQRRENKKSGGVMYDTRCVVSKDPLSKVDDAPLMVFKWGYIDAKGKKIACHRFMKKIS